jgi:RNA polymerase sigma-B factor
LREELIERFMPLAHSLAWRYSASGEPLEDLVQVASEGLVRAVDRYDPDRGVAFTSYATPTILGTLRRYFRDSTQPIHVPRGMGERIQKLQAIADEAGVDVTDPQVLPELARLANLSRAQTQEAIAALRARRPASLNHSARSGEDGESAALIETLGERDRGFERVESSISASDAGLDGRESSVLALRFGRSMTQREVGAKIGVSQMQVSRVQRCALGKLLEAVLAPGATAQLGGPGPVLSS